MTAYDHARIVVANSSSKKLLTDRNDQAFGTRLTQHSNVRGEVFAVEPVDRASGVLLYCFADHVSKGFEERARFIERIEIITAIGRETVQNEAFLIDDRMRHLVHYTIEADLIRREWPGRSPVRIEFENVRSKDGSADRLIAQDSALRAFGEDLWLSRSRGRVRWIPPVSEAVLLGRFEKLQRLNDRVVRGNEDPKFAGRRERDEASVETFDRGRVAARDIDVPRGRLVGRARQ